MTNIEKVIEEIKENCNLLGNNSLKKILDEDVSLDILYKEIRKHNSKLILEEEEETEEGQESQKYLIYVYNQCLDPGNISRIELTQQYEISNSKVTYSIIIYPKFSKGTEGEEVHMNFKIEEERDFYFDVLKMKMKKIIKII